MQIRLGQLVGLCHSKKLVIGTYEIVDSPFRRTSPLALKWYNTKQSLLWSRTGSSVPCCSLGITDKGWSFPRFPSVNCSTWNCSLLYVRAASSKFLTLDSLSLFWYRLACHLQCCISFLKRSLAVFWWSGTNYFGTILTLYYLFCWLLAWIKKKHPRFLASCHASGSCFPMLSGECLGNTVLL